jgi:putative Mg2+ transporter-C (MgtC) family protein
MGELAGLDLLERLALAAALGALVGLERELRHKAAGLRTNVLITLGAALFTIMSSGLTAGTTGDPSRVASQIVSGIGFLGAGAIIRTRGGIQGLTTAATVWMDGAIGMAAGGGAFRLATTATGLTLIVLLVLHPVELFLDRRHAEQPSRPPDAGA